MTGEPVNRERDAHDNFPAVLPPATGDMSWILEDPESADRLAEYEAQLNRFYREHRALGLCLYNRRTIPAEVIDHGIATHSVIRMEGPILLSNPFYEEPEQAAKRKARPDLLESKLNDPAGLAPNSNTSSAPFGG